MKLLIVALLTTQLSLATEPSCDGIISTCQDTVQSYRVLVTDQDKLIVNLTKQRDDLAKQPSSVPWYFWMLIGAAGATAVIGIRR